MGLTNSRVVPPVLLLSLLLCTTCDRHESARPTLAQQKPTPDTSRKPEQAFVRRAFPKTMAGKPLIHGVSYGPFRQGQRPGGPNPTRAQIVEDLKIIAKTWQMIRVYDVLEPTPTILEVIRKEQLPLKVMLGVWLDAKASTRLVNKRVAAAISLANAYGDVVIAVNVGNETQVSWSGHRIPIAKLLSPLRAIRHGIQQPVTTADDYNFWNRSESRALAAEVDFMVLHAYAMWNKQQLVDAVGWTGGVIDTIKGHHPELQVVLGETGWATQMNPEVAEQKRQIRGQPGEAEQAKFFRALSVSLAQRDVPHFYFSAFDEPWKGGADPREVEKHWGLYRVDRSPKQAMRTPELPPK